MISPHRFASRHGGALAWAAAVLGPLALYVLTTSRTVMLEDDGMFLMAGAHLGIGHPPGYPLYVWVCHAFMQLPFGTPAFLGHLSSAVLGALACGFVYWGARVLGVSILPAVAAAWLFGASEHFWSQAIIAEVYTLHALLFFAAYALVLHGIRHRHLAWPWLCAAAAYGLSLANHWPLMGLSTFGLALAALPAWRVVAQRLPSMLGIALPCAILPYAWMVWRSHQEPLINFIGPIDNWMEFWYYLSRRYYAEVDISAGADWADRLAYLQWLGGELVWQLTLPGFLLAMLGLAVLLHRKQLATFSSGLVILGCNSLVLLMALNFEYDYFRVAIFRPYPLVCFGLLALWLAVGLQFVMNSPFWGRLASRMAAARLRHGVAGAAGLLMVGSSVQAHWEANAHASNDFTERFAAATLDALPPNAVLLTSFDADAFPLGYFSLVESRRPDILLLQASGFVYGRRLYAASLSNSSKRGILEDFVERTERPVFFMLEINRDILPRNRKGRHLGFYMQLIKREGSSNVAVAREPRGEEYFRYLLNHSPASRWEHSIRGLWLEHYCHYLGLIKLANPPAHVLEAMRDLYASIGRNTHCVIGTSAVLLKLGGDSHWALAEQWLDQVETAPHEAVSERHLARRYYLQGRVAELQGRKQAAMSLYSKSRSMDPKIDNDAVRAVARLRQSSPSPEHIRESLDMHLDLDRKD